MKNDACVWCGLPEKDQHTNGQSGICSAIRSGKLTQAEGQKLVKKIPFTTKNK